MDGKYDTSNFDEFEPKRDSSSTRFQNRTDKRAFTGADLPFVGFTFMKNMASTSADKYVDFTLLLNSYF